LAAFGFIRKACGMRRVWKKIWIACVICVVVALLLNVGALGYEAFNSGGGVVTRISAKSKGNDEILLKLTYAFPTGGYSVRTVPEDEGEYIGDGMIDYDGSLGKYRIMVKFGDAEPSMRHSLRLLNETTLLHVPVKLKASVAHPSDHGFVLYIGSDTPISVEAVERGELNSIGGTVQIPIYLNRK